MAWVAGGTGKTQSGGVSATTVACALSAPVAAGDVVVAAVNHDTSVNNVTTASIADSLGNTWSLLAQLKDATANQGMSWWYTVVTNAGTPTVTVTFPSGTLWRTIAAQAYSNSAGTISLDVAGTCLNGSYGAGTDAVVSNAITTTANGDLVLGAFCNCTGGNAFTAGTGYTADTNATSASQQMLESLMQGSSGSVTPTATQGGGAQRCIGAAAAFKVTIAVPTNTVAPVASGTATVGQTLSVTNGSWTGSPSSFAYQWQRDNTGGGVYSNIGSATSSTYLLVSADLGCNVRCRVTATNGGGASSPAASNALGLVVAAPVVTGVPTVSVRIAPGSDANDQNPRWSEVALKPDGSSYLLGFHLERGRQAELDRVQAGTGSFVFNNSTRFLDPSYAVGPFAPNLKPNMQISVQAAFAGTTYDLFRGHVERFTTSYDGPNYAGTTLECVDRFASLGQATITGTFAEQRTGARILAVLAAAGWPTTVTPSGWTLGTGTLGGTARLGAVVPINNLDTGRETVDTRTFVTTDKKLALEHIQEVADSEPGRFFFNGAGVGVFQDRSRVVPIPVASVLTLTDDASAADATHVPYTDITLNYEIDAVMNDVQLTGSDGVTVVESTDTPSVDSYWRRTLPRATQIRNLAALYQQAGWFLFGRKDAVLRVQEVTVAVWRQTDFTAILARELGDHVTVLRTPPGATVATLTQESFIEKVSLDVSPGSVWTATYELSAIVQVTPLWRLGTGQLGSTARLSYA